MANSKALHQAFNLYITPDAYTFEPIDPNGNADAISRSLTINRHSGDIALNDSNTPMPSKSFQALTVYGILGIISLSTADYLLLITGRSLQRGRMNGHSIYLATDFRLFPISPPTPTNSIAHHPVEKHLLDLVHSHLNESILWFSYGWDLTRRLQNQSEEADRGKALWETADDRFFWNRHVQSRLIDITLSNPSQDLSSYILPVIFGSFETRQTHIGRIPFIFALISRRSRYRAGTRYFTRGIDAHGHVANFNETEQIIFIDEEDDKSEAESLEKVGYGGLSEVNGSTRMSFVQTRGSVPVYWAEINNLRYKPDLQVMELDDTADALALHLTEQLHLYGPQTLVNLVKQKGHEKPIKEAYERRVTEAKAALPNGDGAKVGYEYFDFATECKNMKFEKVEILIDRLAETLKAMSWYHQNARSPSPVSIQTGVIRTNCMDCLDRTNVVQSALGKYVLSQQLRSIGVLYKEQTLEDHEDFMHVFRNVWADHADYISKAYSGTGALKTDFTRTGTRTKQGLLQDGQNSIMRYVKNNYFDGDRQDAYDLFTGAWVPRRGPAASVALITDSRPLITRSMPYTLLFSVFMILAGLTLPRSSNYSLLYYNIFWLFIVSLSAFYIIGHGVEYVAWPRLNPPIETIFYEGPGFKSGSRGKGFGFAIAGLQNVPWARRIKKGVMNGVGTVSGGRKRAGSRSAEIEMGLKKRVD